MKKQLNLTSHALLRLNKRFKITADNAQNFVNQVMETAKKVSVNGTKDLYYHKGRDMFLVINESEGNLITVYHADPVKNEEADAVVTKVTVSSIVEAVTKELKKMKRNYTRESRKIKEERALLLLKIAEMRVNKTRCKAPHTIEIIQNKINDVELHVALLNRKLNELKKEVDTAERQVKAIL